MHVSKGEIGNASGFRFAGVVNFDVWCDGVLEFHIVIDHSILWNFFESDAVKTKHRVELIHVHDAVNPKEPELDLSPVFPIYKP